MWVDVNMPILEFFGSLKTPESVIHPARPGMLVKVSSARDGVVRIYLVGHIGLMFNNYGYLRAFFDADTVHAYKQVITFGDSTSVS